MPEKPPALVRRQCLARFTQYQKPLFAEVPNPVHPLPDGFRVGEPARLDLAGVGEVDVLEVGVRDPAGHLAGESGGIGAAEASLPAGLIAVGVDQTTAFAIAITRRLSTFYLPTCRPSGVTCRFAG